METAGKKSKLRYSAEDYPRYEQQLRALCLKSAGGWILSKLVINPIDKFASNHKEAFAADASKTPTAKQITATAESISNLINELASPSSAVSAEATPAKESTESKDPEKLQKLTIRKPTDDELKRNPLAKP